MRKKFFANLVVLAIFAGAVFYAGWIQFQVKAGTCAIMTSKTCGLHDGVFSYGEFAWRWERLLPTNITLESFNIGNREYQFEISGQLPCAGAYSSVLPEKNDFAYSYVIKLNLGIESQAILDLYKGNKIRTNQDLDSYLETKGRLAGSLIAEYLTKDTSYIKKISLTEDEMSALMSGHSRDFSGIGISSVSLVSAKYPDIELYEKAKAAYDGYYSSVGMKLEEQSAEQARIVAEQERSMKQLEKLGLLLKNYPELSEIFKNSDAAQIVNILNSIK